MGNEKMPIDVLILLVGTAASMASTFGDVFEDGKVNWQDAPSVGSLFMDFKSLADINFTQVIPQASDLSGDEIAKLDKVFDDKFDLKNDALEARIELGLDKVQRALDAIMFFKNFK